MQGTLQADWLVIGAGITGLSAAHSLAALHPEAHIVIIDRQHAAQGASARNSGFVVAHEHPAENELMGSAGFAGFEVDTAISRAASDEVRQRIGRHGIDCDFRDNGYFFAVHDADKLSHVEAKLATLRAMEPKLHEVYGVSGSWQAVIEAQMDFPATVADKIKEIWQANVDKFASAGTAINAQDFAQHFVDTNFP